MLTKLIVDRYLDLPTFNQQSPPANLAWPTDIVLVPNRTYNIAQSHHEGSIFKGRQRVSQVTVGAHASKVHRSFRWLPWLEGKLSCMTLAGADILTGKMSGCWLTIFQYNGAYYAGHIGTSVSSTSALTVQAKAAWRNAVAANHITPIAAFNPIAGFNMHNLNLQGQAAEFYGAWEPTRSVYTVVLAASMLIKGGAQRRRIAKVISQNPSVDVTAF